MENRIQFVATWDYYMILATAFFVVATVVIFAIHEIRVVMIKDLKEKYEYVTHYEIKNFWFTMVSAIIAATFISNTFMTDWIVGKGWKWLAGRVFITICLAIFTYVVLASLIRIYYPRFMEGKLNKLRNRPRISPAGNEMRKLSETEEDAHLEADQIAQEGSEVHSVDYDVWIDEKTGYKKIEKYHPYEHAIECPDCGYVTMKIHHEEVEVVPTQTEAGELIKHYRCGNCSHRERRSVHLAKLADNI